MGRLEGTEVLNRPSGRVVLSRPDAMRALGPRAEPPATLRPAPT